ncbi:MAG: hypothetical protein ABR573_01960 [Candidatus Dormibacteria bacterium]
MDDRGRRERLQRLDSILDRLERLNLEDSNRLTPELRADLAGEGVRAPAQPNVTALIERIWELQEEFLDPEESADARGLPARRPTLN